MFEITPQRAYIAAASVGAVVGFTLVVLVLTDNALTWCPLLVVPSIATDWKARCAVQQNMDELQQFLRDFGFVETSATLYPRLIDLPAAVPVYQHAQEFRRAA